MKITEVTDNKIEYVWSEGDFDEDEYDRDAFYRESYALANTSGMNILRDKSPSCYAVSKGHAVGCLFVTDSNDKYSFDIVVSPKFQNQGIGAKLADFAVQEYNQRKDAYDDYDYSIDVINPSMKSILLKKGFVVLKDLGASRWLMGNKTKISEVIIDNLKGLGSVPNNDNIDYMGLRVMMKPTTFLNLATYAGRNSLPNIDALKELIQSGKSIGAPWLVIQIPISWEDGDFKNIATVVGHEGRNRMFAVRELEGDDPIEVHLFFNHGIKARHITPEWIHQLNSQLYPQGTTIDYNTGVVKYPQIHSLKKGPFFQIKGKIQESFEKSQDMTLWHGGRNLQFNHMNMIPSRTGHWEYGPGLYLTTHYETANKYAKGGGTTYKVTINKGTDIADVIVDLNDAIDFVKRYVKVDCRRPIIKDLSNNFERLGKLQLEVLVNLCVNYEALTPKNTVALRKFLIGQDADYHISKGYAGRNETIVIVFNPTIIKKIEPVKASAVTLDQREQYID